MSKRHAPPHGNNNAKKQRSNSPVEGRDENDEISTVIDSNTPLSGLDAVTPNRNVPYMQQLTKKRREFFKTVTRLTREIESSVSYTNRQLKNHHKNGVVKNLTLHETTLPYRTKRGSACPAGPVLPSPIQQGYRNKNEFTIGVSQTEVGEIEVGFLSGRFIDGARVGSPEGCLSCPDYVLDIAAQVKHFLNTNEFAKKYSPWHKDDSLGVYRLLTLRDCPVTRQVMICLQINPISFTPEHNHLTEALPRDIVASYDSLTKEEQKAVREKHTAQRTVQEIANIQSNADYQAFCVAFRDFCIERFYGGAIWREPLSDAVKALPRSLSSHISPDETASQGFVPPCDSYDSLPDLTPSNPLFANSKTYKGIGAASTEPTATQVSPTVAADAAGAIWTQRYGMSLASVLVQSHTGVANTAELNALQDCLFGTHHIFAQISGLHFRVAVNSFLQVNRLAATSLYNIASTWALMPKHDWSLTTKQTKSLYLDKLLGFEEKFCQSVFDNGGWKTMITPTHELNLAPQDFMAPPPVDAITSPSVLFDVCCGTGTIGLINAKYAQKVVGIDIVQAAIDDAIANAKLNAIDNAEFICGKAEEVMDNVLQRYGCVPDDSLNPFRHTEKTIGENGQEVKIPYNPDAYSVAIVDPPRNGLHTRVVRALRESNISRVVYISCNQKTLEENAVRLCGPQTKNYPGLPFIPLATISMDLFPHTVHTEAVMIFERKPENYVAPPVDDEDIEDDKGYGHHLFEQLAKEEQATATTTPATDASVQSDEPSTA